MLNSGEKGIENTIPIHSFMACPFEAVLNSYYKYSE